MNLKTGLFDIKSLNYVILTSIPKPLVKVYVFSTGVQQLFGYVSVVVQLISCVQLCAPTDCSTLGFPVLHYLLEFDPIHVH